MPPKKRKRQSRKTTQSQRQSVIVNIGSKSAPRKKSGRGGLPPPSHMHNLAPTFVTSPQIDYTPILAMLTQQTRSLQPEAPRNPVTPLSSVMATQTAEQMAGEAALRRAGNTAANFQPPPSLADERRVRRDEPFQDPFGFPEPVRKSVSQIQQELQYIAGNKLRELEQARRQSPLQEAEEAIGLVQEALRPPDPSRTEVLRPLKSQEPFERGIGAGGGIPSAESRPARGRPKKGTQRATPLGQQTLAAEEKKANLGDIRPFLKPKK